MFRRIDFILAAGQHRLLAEPGLFTVTNVLLQTPRSGSAPAAGPARTLRVLSWGPDNRSVRIGPGPQSYVEVHQNANAGWGATLNGRRLTPAVLDGWQQGFVVPAGAGGVITMTFGPATWYHASLALSALAIIGLIVVAAGWKRWMSYVLPITYFVIIEVGTALLLRGTRVAALWLIPAGPRVVRAEVEAEFARRVGPDIQGKTVTIYDHTDAGLTYTGTVRRPGTMFLPRRGNTDSFLGTDTRFEIGGRSISAELAASLILRSLRASAEQALGSPVRRCLASYPANFSIAQRNALQRAFELAGLDIYRMIGEPNVPSP